MAAMLEERNNKNYLHKNRTFFPVERNSIVFLLQHGRCEHTLFYYCNNDASSPGGKLEMTVTRSSKRYLRAMMSAV